MKRFSHSVLLVVIASIALTGCATTGHRLGKEQIAAIETRLDSESPPDELRPLYRILYMEGDRNYVLNAMKLAGIAIRLGYYDDARRMLDECIIRIEAISAGDKRAAAARSTFEEEAVKPFKGEPYERAMVYFYRGLLYYRDGVYDNARACFRSASLEDAQAEGEHYKADYASFDYLAGRCSQKLRTGDSEDAFQRAQRFLPSGGSLPSTDPDNNLLLVIGVGNGPFKYADGPHGERLRFHEQITPEVRARAFVDGSVLATTSPLDDLYFQATTRGGRRMDYILHGKAVFKETAGTVGNVGLMTGAGLAIAGANSSKRRDELYIAGAAAAGIGLIAKIFESQARPEADLRQWDNLPHTIHIVSAKLPVGQHQLRVEFLDAHGVKVNGLDREQTITIPADNQEQVVIVHSR